jgi:CRISPR-associated endoribonuclease Cas6
MLLSVMISLIPVRPAPILGALGRPVQAWFLQQVTKANPGMAAALHDSKGPKPYTVSTLLDERGRPLQAGSWLQTGKPVWQRWTVFESHLADLLQKQILPYLPASMTLYKMGFRLDGFTFDPAQHPWAGQTSYAGLAQETGLPEKARPARLEFMTPTAFRSEGADIPLPIPGHVFRGYWQKWNAFAPEAYQINPVWPEFANACLIISELADINTGRWVFADGTRGAATGFTGVAGFSLLAKKQCGEFAAYREGAERVLNHLARFAFYCGTGHHTTIGLGQTRLLLPDR